MVCSLSPLFESGGLSDVIEADEETDHGAIFSVSGLDFTNVPSVSHHLYVALGLFISCCAFPSLLLIFRFFFLPS